MSSEFVVHGHFYQPPRENPWTGLLEQEPSAQPFHDWNQRVHSECYRPNAFARVLDGYGRVERIVNNYGHINFNFGPTQLNWLVPHDPETYRRILEADRLSSQRHGGHGNAIAQGYNHAILPLCNPRDQLTQVLWGLADFRSRFDRSAESLWLPETACNDAVLGTLIDAGLSYVILSPQQAHRVRTPGEEWLDVSSGNVDTSQGYRYLHQDGSGRSIAVFFYNGPLARGIAFEGSLYASQTLLERAAQAKGPGPLIFVATDGESYGHHAHFGDRTLAYAMEMEAQRRGLDVTNLGRYLEEHPPTHEVEINLGPEGEGSSWSCIHGVGRWYRDCGCTTGSQEGWNQAWRGPLRQALNFLRDEAAGQFEQLAQPLLKDPWAARNDYVLLVLDEGRGKDIYLARHAVRELQSEQRIRALLLMELQRHSMTMFTSCGWFFADIGGLEAVQVMKYAGRVLDLLAELGLPSPRERFLEMLGEARSNTPALGTGADIFRKQVDPLRMTPERMVAHLAISGMQDHDADGVQTTASQIGGYAYQRRDTRKGSLDRLLLATGRLTLEVPATGQQFDYIHATIYLGSVDFSCLIRPYQGQRRFTTSVERIWEEFGAGGLLAIMRAGQAEFGPAEFGLEDVLPHDRQKILENVFSSLIGHYYDQYSRMYEDNRRIITLLQDSGFVLPRELMVAAEFTLGRRLEEEIRQQQGSRSPEAYSRAVEIAQEASRRGYRLESAVARETFELMIVDAVQHLSYDSSPASAEAALALLRLCKELQLVPNLDHAQEQMYAFLLSRREASQDSLAKLAAELSLSPSLLRPGP